MEDIHVTTEQPLVEKPAKPRPDFKELLADLRDQAENLRGEAELLTGAAEGLLADLKDLVTDEAVSDSDEIDAAITAAIDAADRLYAPASVVESEADDFVVALDEAEDAAAS